MNQFEQFTAALEEWFEQNQRNFPWRENRNPYWIWVSEIMSHQTQIDRVAEKFFPRFIGKFPDIESFAEADWEKDIFPVWEGLGYYNRGKNMQKTARIICNEYEGNFPQKVEYLETLPGIGKYTACAICSFAFNQKVPAIDTNISKIINILWPEKNTIKTAEELINLSTSGYIWNSAMMDLASQLRTGKEIEGKLGELFFPKEIAEKFIPQRKKRVRKKTNKKSNKRIEVGIACIWKDGHYLIQTRPKGKSFVGFWEFPGGKRESGESFRDCVKREIKEEIGVTVSVRPHFYEELCTFSDNNTELLLRFHRCQIQSGTPQPLEKQELSWIRPEDFFSDIKFLATNHKALKVLQKMKV